VIVAGGMGCNPPAPLSSKKYRSGRGIADTVYAILMLDGLEDAYRARRAIAFAAEAAWGISSAPGHGRLRVESLPL
jgi:hypothetical protein